MFCTPRRAFGIASSQVLSPYSFVRQVTEVNYQIETLVPSDTSRCPLTDFVHVARLKPYHWRPTALPWQAPRRRTYLQGVVLRGLIKFPAIRGQYIGTVPAGIIIKKRDEQDADGEARSFPGLRGALLHRVL